MKVVKKWNSSNYKNKLLFKKAIVFIGGLYYLVSENLGMNETFIFTSDDTGYVYDYNKVGGGMFISMEDVLSNFSNYLFKDEL